MCVFGIAAAQLNVCKQAAADAHEILRYTNEYTMDRDWHVKLDSSVCPSMKQK